MFVFLYKTKKEVYKNSKKKNFKSLIYRNLVKETILKIYRRTI